MCFEDMIAPWGHNDFLHPNTHLLWEERRVPHGNLQTQFESCMKEELCFVEFPANIRITNE